MAVGADTIADDTYYLYVSVRSNAFSDRLKPCMLIYTWTSEYLQQRPSVLLGSIANNFNTSLESDINMQSNEIMQKHTRIFHSVMLSFSNVCIFYFMCIEFSFFFRSPVHFHRFVPAPMGVCVCVRVLASQTPLPEQECMTDGIELDLETTGTKELAFHITLFDWDLFWSIHEYELLYHTFGRHHFGKVKFGSLMKMVVIVRRVIYVYCYTCLSRHFVATSIEQCADLMQYNYHFRSQPTWIYSSDASTRCNIGLSLKSSHNPARTSECH